MFKERWILVENEGVWYVGWRTSLNIFVPYYSKAVYENFEHIGELCSSDELCLFADDTITDLFPAQES